MSKEAEIASMYLANDNCSSTISIVTRLCPVVIHRAEEKKQSNLVNVISTMFDLRLPVQNFCPTQVSTVYAVYDMC